MNELLTIGNNSQEITSTNYWELPYNTRGEFYISINAACVRLLIPEKFDADIDFIDALLSSKQIILSILKKYLIEENKLAIELMFDDHSQNPYCIHMGAHQIDRLFLNEDNNKITRFISYAKGLRVVNDTHCGIRHVNKIPCMSEWKGDKF